MSNILESKQPTVTSEPQKVVAQKNLLLVEDVRVSQRVARVALNRARFRVDIAMDGLEAVELYSKGKFDVILMDIQLPRMNGIDATQRIREIEGKENREKVVIFGLTGSLSDSDLESYKKVGMNGCIGKGNILEQAVPEALAEHEAKPHDFIVCRIGGLVSPGPLHPRTLGALLHATSTPSAASSASACGAGTGTGALPLHTAPVSSSHSAAPHSSVSSRAVSSRATGMGTSVAAASSHSTSFSNSQSFHSHPHWNAPVSSSSSFTSSAPAIPPSSNADLASPSSVSADPMPTQQ